MTHNLAHPTDRTCYPSSSSSSPVADESNQPSSLQQLFAVLDEDSDGRLSLHEMCSLLAKLGINSTLHSDALLSLIHSTLNLNQDQHQQTSSTHDDYLHSLDFPQFAQLYASLFSAQSQDCATRIPADGDDGSDDELLRAFQVYDKNRDGFISAAELAAVLRDLGLLPAGDHGRHSLDAQLGICQTYIESVDLDGNGMVDLQEFKAMLMYPPTCGHSCSKSMSQAGASMKPGLPFICRT